MRGHDIRTAFLNFFKERDHKIYPSASLIPDDPTLLLTVAGMVPFKAYFEGKRPIDDPRAASAQKCARTNDIENVGVTARHQTVFEMLGNFSFGEYFKEEAIRWAWELSTGPFGLDPERIWVSAYEQDDETVAIWRDQIGLPAKRIIRRGKEDNYWWMGVPGPGGPCSELFYDRGPAFGTVDGFEDGDRIMEYYNLVFTQFEVDARGEPVSPLPKPNVDTGMGLERITQILQEVPSAYETDLLKPIVDVAALLAQRPYGDDETTDVSLRIMAEHARAAMFLIGDGVLPSNEERGYVLRRLIRRAVRRAKLLGVDDMVMPSLAAAAISTMGEAYPDLIESKAYIEQVVTAEEESFRHTLRQGLTMLGVEIETKTAAKSTSLPGDVAFKLHDTYGFPLELTVEIAQEAGLEVDRKSFDRLMEEQRDRARSARKVDLRDEDALRDLLAAGGASRFIGYEHDETEAKIVGIVAAGQVVETANEGTEVEVILDASPFYPEGGGQIGDAGTIESEDAIVEIFDTRRRLGDLIVHRGIVRRGELRSAVSGRAVVDGVRRGATMRSHTATHILHATLRAALGEHARQAGSLVEPGRLRFDFAHHSRVPRELLDEVEATVNARLTADEIVRPYETTMDEARNRGALMLFEEKYGDIVRVIEIGDYSVELCGGIHVARTSQVGVVKIVGEGSISAGIRRIEALSGGEAIEHHRTSRALLEQIAALVKASPEDAPAKVERLLSDLRDAEQEVKRARSAGQADIAGVLAAKATKYGDVSVVVSGVEGVPVGELQKLAVAVREQVGGPAVVILASASDGRAGIVAALDKATAVRVKAPALIAEAARAIGGGAGGKDDVATGGGKDAAGVEEALRLAAAKAAELFA